MKCVKYRKIFDHQTYSKQIECNEQFGNKEIISGINVDNIINDVMYYIANKDLCYAAMLNLNH